MRRFLMAIALTCVFSSSTLAGDMPIVPGPDPTPPAQTTSITEQIIGTIIDLIY